MHTTFKKELILTQTKLENNKPYTTSRLIVFNVELIAFEWNTQRFVIACVIFCPLLSSFFLFLIFCQPCLRVRNCKSILLILEISLYSRLRWWVQLFPRYSCKNWCKNGYLHFNKTYGYGIGKHVQLGELSEMRIIRQVDAIFWSHGLEIKTFYLHYHDAHGHQMWQGCDLP